MLRKNNIPDLDERLRDDPERARRYRLEQGGWSLDYGRFPLTDRGRDRLLSLPHEHRLAEAVECLFAGDTVNPTEGHPALHMAHRATRPEDCLASDAAAGLTRERERFLALAGELHGGNSRLGDLIHIGIGGSDLGPRLVADALDEDDGAVRVHWLSGLDARRLQRLLRRLDPDTTGMVVASKSFATEETLVQAQAVRDWLGARWAERAWAATAGPERAVAFGLDRDRVLTLPESTGGRFSLWSPAGVSAAACIGPARFGQLLAGAEAADRDFRAPGDAPGLAVVLALLVHYLRRELDLPTLGIVSYEPRLALLAEYLQQLVMESLGKGVDLAGRALDRPAAPLVFGGRGTDLQHAIFQALHQGIDTHPLILVGTRRGEPDLADWHRRQMAHLQAQATALARGRGDGEPHQRLPGNRPVATLIGEQLDPQALGWLLATLEHAVYAVSVLWRVNAFDQWGVEEGKRLAAEFRRQTSRD